MKFRLLLLLIILTALSLHAQKKFLFDATKAETAGNADWVIDQDGSPQRFPTPAEATVTASTAENYWTGALSAWGIGLVKMGHHVETLPSGTAITYNNASNVQDLKNYDVFIVDEPNIPFTAAEKTAIVEYVKNGGGLFMIADHSGADRNNDGWDPVRVWNDLFRNNSVQSLPFGMILDSNSISQTSSNVVLASPVIINGPAGQVIQCMYSAGSTITLNPATNATVKGVIWQSGAAQSTTKVMVAYAKFGSGKVVLVGDSSPADDGTGAPGNTLYNGWLGDVGPSHANIHLNGSVWLATNDSAVTTAEHPIGSASEFQLQQNYPNPFNPSTEIRFTVRNSGTAVVSVYNMLGQETAVLFNGIANPGQEYRMMFDASSFPGGVYLYRLQSGDQYQIRKMMFIK
ncbi:MAG: T9SS type A sorting domain-containing protein [Bacteroidota bacterium]